MSAEAWRWRKLWKDTLGKPRVNVRHQSRLRSSGDIGSPSIVERTSASGSGLS
jgi:hypothetical protein